MNVTAPADISTNRDLLLESITERAQGNLHLAFSMLQRSMKEGESDLSLSLPQFMTHCKTITHLLLKKPASPAYISVILIYLKELLARSHPLRFLVEQITQYLFEFASQKKMNDFPYLAILNLSRQLFRKEIVSDCPLEEMYWYFFELQKLIP
jgi:hypothetical protein